jgi:hypothetical protein
VRGLGGRKSALGDELRPDDMQIGYVAAVADLDGDGARDLVTQLTPLGERTARLYVVRGAGDGRTSSIIELKDAAQYQTIILDADGDETLDVIGLRHVPGDAAHDVRLETLIWSGASDYRDTYVGALTPLRPTLGSRFDGRTATDLDLDGHDDLVFAPTTIAVVADQLCDLPPAFRTVHVAFGDGKGGLTEPPCHPAFTGDPVDLAVADLNGDGAPDIAAATLQGVELLLSNP